MVNVDKLIEDPNKPEMNGRKTRAEPLVNFFGQPGIQTKKWAYISKQLLTI